MEIELRIRAHELALIEVAAHIDEAALREAIEAIRAGLVMGIGADELVIRAAAIEHLETALARHHPPAAGMHWRE